MRRISFWPFVFGVLVLIWGAVTLVSRLLAIVIDVSWWGIFTVIVGVWLLVFAVRKEVSVKP